ncbi:phosphotransferase [Pseudonocardia sp. HH130630-07]|uniref:phosphotransferase n=1 Tax=Pseudonocardia sp. HH130630-07 TaxID=1690815 RepID=UPI000814C55B|nr:phosphotransferase [Pseudonocardia sp. HH130630-07]ANY08113.1 hypothetical protein AFB00_19510 [Pseudonocardia sp. HH130630-07]
MTVGVVRAGDTVRRPAGPHTPAVHALLDHLRGAGLQGVPRVFGTDRRGREILSFAPGAVVHPDHNGLVAPDRALSDVAGWIRDFHSASAEFVSPPDARWQNLFGDVGQGVIAHNDLGRWNLVRDDGGGWTFIDWDAAAPADPLWDLAYAAHGLVPLSPTAPRGLEHVDRDRRLRLLASVYGLDEAARRRLPGLVTARADAQRRLVVDGAAAGREQWRAQLRDGHHHVWARAAAFARAGEARWRRVLLAGD